MNCRFCDNHLKNVFVDLGVSPLANSYLNEAELDHPEVSHPLKVYVCDKCFLVQIDEYETASDIFSDEYAYFSSFSRSWVEHARKYVEIISGELLLGPNSFVVEIASNDGYLLQHFVSRHIPCLGIEPTGRTAEAAREKGIEVAQEFFGSQMAKQLVDQGRQADLIVGNNVLAHVPDIIDFVKGLKIALKQEGTITMEFPHVINLIKENQFDTIYHEHFSYLSLTVVRNIFESCGLSIYNVEELPTHGGSIRIYACHTKNIHLPILDSVTNLCFQEEKLGIKDVSYYASLQDNADSVKTALLEFLLAQQEKGNRVAAYGAAAKGNTLLNYSGIGSDLIDFVVDASPHKQGKFLPGSHIPIVDEKLIRERQPGFILILPWNLKDEIVAQLDYVKSWGGKFVTAIPKLSCF